MACVGVRVERPVRLGDRCAEDGNAENDMLFSPSIEVLSIAQTVGLL